MRVELTNHSGAVIRVIPEKADFYKARGYFEPVKKPEPKPAKRSRRKAVKPDVES